MAGTGEGIRITGYDEKKTQPSSKGGARYDVHFILSREPPMEWTRIFDYEWKLHIYTLKRHAWVEGSYLVVCCPLSELELQLSEVNAVLGQVNAAYLKGEEEWRKAASDEQAEELMEEKRKIDALKKLRFD